MSKQCYDSCKLVSAKDRTEMIGLGMVPVTMPSGQKVTWNVDKTCSFQGAVAQYGVLCPTKSDPRRTCASVATCKLYVKPVQISADFWSSSTLVDPRATATAEQRRHSTNTLEHFYNQHQKARQQWADKMPLLKDSSTGKCTSKPPSTRRICSQEQIDTAMREAAAPLRFQIANGYTTSVDRPAQNPRVRSEQLGEKAFAATNTGRRGGLKMQPLKCAVIASANRGGNDEEEDLGAAKLDLTGEVPSGFPGQGKYASSFHGEIAKRLKQCNPRAQVRVFPNKKQSNQKKLSVDISVSGNGDLEYIASWSASRPNREWSFADCSLTVSATNRAGIDEEIWADDDSESFQ